MTRFRWGLASDVGRVRSVNQDNALAIEGLFAVADGMGGHRGGEVASEVAVRALQDRAPLLSSVDLIEAIHLANDAILEQSHGDESLRGMGTTLCVLALVDAEGEERLAVANVGDSRIYLFASGELEQMTDDHSLVAALVREGRITQEEAEDHPQRNILTRALGIDHQVSVDAWEVAPFVGDRWVLCSDGLFNEVSVDQMAAVLRRLADPDDAARELVRLANDGGGRDNITVLIVDLVDDEGHAAIAPGGPDTVTAAADHAGGAAGSAVLLDAPTDDMTSEARGNGAPRRSSNRPRFTWRVALFLFALLALIAVVIGAIAVFGTDDGDDTPPSPTVTTVPAPTSTTSTTTLTPSTTTAPATTPLPTVQPAPTGG
jgi:protein phosphatase